MEDVLTTLRDMLLTLQQGQEEHEQDGKDHIYAYIVCFTSILSRSFLIGYNVDHCSLCADAADAKAAASEEAEMVVDRQYKQVVVQWCAALSKLVYAESN